MEYIKKYHDEIWLISEDDSEELVWRNNERDRKWDDDPDGNDEYDEMMRLHDIYDFHDYDHCTNFEHREIETTYKVTKKEISEINRKEISRCGLVEEFYNT